MPLARIVARLLPIPGMDYAGAVVISRARLIAKGDTPGHEFHGNQWTGGQGGAWDASPKEVGTLYHGSKQKIGDIDPTKTQQRDAGFYGTGFYTTTEERVSRMYGGRVTRMEVNPDAKVLRSSLDPTTAPKGFVDEVKNWARGVGEEKARARGKEAAFNDEIEQIGTNNIEWKNAVDRYAEAHSYDVVIHSGSEVVIKNPKAVTIRKADGLANLVTKGEGPGHPFRGNQYTTGESGGGEASQDAGGKWHVGGNVELALKLIGEGKDVVLEQPRELSTLIDKLASMAKEAAASGKVYDLCRVTVSGTNLFCAESKGIARAEMPQLKGVPTAGSQASTLPSNSKGEVDLSDKFMAHLQDQGHAVERTREDAAFLRASQREIDGVKIAGMMKAMQEGKIAEEPIWVSKDNYIIDGHHRWAATVALEYSTGKKITMPVRRIDTGITQALSESKKFAADWGIPQRAVGKLVRMLTCGGEALIKLVKGEDVGHPFRGNQWTSGTTGAEMIERAVKEFGITSDPREAGYLLPDGKMLDFSGKREGGTAGERAYDHRDIGRAFEDTDFQGGTEGMFDFAASSGAIRMSYHSAERGASKLPSELRVDFYSTPTSEQVKTIERIGAEVINFDATKGDGYVLDSDEIDGYNIESMVARVNRAFYQVKKGESAGHPFRGNQWTSGEAGGAQTEPSGERKLSYHLTDNPNFVLNPELKPENATTYGGDWPNAGIFVGEDPERWFNGYDYVRPFVAELSHPPVESMGPKAMPKGGYSGEQFIPGEAFGQVRVDRVIPYDEWVRERFHDYGPVEEFHGTDSSGKPLPQAERHTGSLTSRRPTAGLVGYQYKGKDVREMSPVQQKKLAQRTDAYARAVRPHLFAKGALLIAKEFTSPSGPTTGLAGYSLEGQRETRRARIARLRAKLKMDKGDVPGHEFHGNQWTAGQGLSVSAEGNAVHLKGIVYHSETKGSFGEPSAEIGNDFDIYGKGFYFGTKEVAAGYGTPRPFEIEGKFASNEFWSKTLKEFETKPFNEGRSLSREKLKALGYVGVYGGRIGLVWDQKSIRAVNLSKLATDNEAHRAATSPFNLKPLPSAGQKDAGNYSMGHLKIAGLDVSVENPAGSSRRPEWAPLTAHYGYARPSRGADGEHVDVFVRVGTPENYAGAVFIVDQVNPSTGAFDEHKVMIGWPDEESARRAYASNYEPGWKGLGAIEQMSMQEFKGWLASGDTRAPVVLEKECHANF